MKSIIQLTFMMLFSFLTTLQGEEKKGFLTSEEIALFYKQGYLLKSNCLSENEISALREEVSNVIDISLREIQHSQVSNFSNQDQFLFVNGSRIVFKRPSEQEISIARINGCAGIEPSLLTTIRSEKMLYTFFELLGTNDLEHLIAQIHPKLPKDGITYPRHQDIQFRTLFDPNWQDILGNGSYAICIIPIDPMTPENGGLWIDRNNYPEFKREEEDIVWIHAEPGDLLFMHPYLFHGSGPNLSEDSRMTLLTGFCAFGANHKAYPGALVNTHISLLENGEISITEAPWSQNFLNASSNGH